MYDPPAYVWALTIAGPAAIAAATCIALYGGGAVRAGLGRRRAALLAGAAAVLLGGWFTATAVIAGHGWYDTRPSQVPRLPIAAAGSLHTLLALSRIPAVARAAEKTMQPEIDPLKEAAPERAAVGTRGLTKRFRSVARLARRARSVARRPPKPITCETAERTSHAVYRNR